jgi:hypothetical protein
MLTRSAAQREHGFACKHVHLFQATRTVSANRVSTAQPTPADSSCEQSSNILHQIVGHRQHIAVLPGPSLLHPL